MSDQSAGRPKGGVLKWSLWGVGLAGVAAVVYIIARSSDQSAPDHKPETSKVVMGAPRGLKALATGAMAKLTLSAPSTPPPDYIFYDAGGKALKLADFKGKVVVLNLWATWCAPCVTEMPTVAKMAQAYAGKPVAVIALSIDKENDIEKAKSFISRSPPLAFYNDPTAHMPWALKPVAAGVPITVIYGKDGSEKARLSGGADWSGAEAKAVVDAVLAEG